jgi:hypothetical protein
VADREGSRNDVITDLGTTFPDTDIELCMGRSIALLAHWFDGKGDTELLLAGGVGMSRDIRSPTSLDAASL